jgi:hypothetical protein
MNIAAADGSVTVVYPLVESSVISHLAERIVVDDGAIRIDSANHTLDESHLVLDGVLSSGQDYFKVIRAGVKKLNCDHNGQLHCHADITAPVISGMLIEIGDLTTQNTNLATAVGANALAIANATHENTHDTLVKRNNNVGETTDFYDVTANVVTIQQAVALYGDAAVSYTPQDDNDVNKVGYTYRFGRNTEELGDLSGVGDGLEMKEPDDNAILIQVNQSTPTIEAVVNKSNTNIPYMLFKRIIGYYDAIDESGNPVSLPIYEKLVQIDQAGISQILVEVDKVQCTPGNKLHLSTLRNGYQSHVFELSSAWSDSINHTIIEISQPATSGSRRVIENLECCLDDLASGWSEHHSRLYIKQWGIYRNTNHTLYIMLAVDYHNDETTLFAESIFRITFNNKLLL